MTMLVQSTLQRNNGQMALLVPGAATRKPGIFLILDDQVFYKDNGVKRQRGHPLKRESREKTPLP